MNGIDALVGANIRAHRAARGWTQGDLAGALTYRGLPLDATAIVRIEQGKRALRINQAEVIAALFEVPLAEIVPSDRSDLFKAGFDAGLRAAIERITRKEQP